MHLFSNKTLKLLNIHIYLKMFIYISCQLVYGIIYLLDMSILGLY